MASLSVQNEMQLVVTAQAAPDGIEMGVLSDGTPYLTARGLAGVCGVAPGIMTGLLGQWELQQLKPRGKKIIQLITEQGGDPNRFTRRAISNGQSIYAVSDLHCMAVLEYYAFEANDKLVQNETALRNYRSLARYGLGKFIYQNTGYKENEVPEHWRIFHERMTLNEVPSGYFSVFEEMSNLTVAAIRKGMPFDAKSVPDISVGQTWAKYWKERDFEQVHGKRIQHLHKFPKDFPQVDPLINIYPISALGEFRQWMDDVYLPSKFGVYLKGKVKKGTFDAELLPKLVAAVQPTRITQLD